MRCLGASIPSFGFLLATVVGCAATAPPASHVVDERRAAHTRAEVAAAFAELGDLAGSWEGVTSAGRTSRVGYRISAGESVLVETWTQARGREALTIYHVDGTELLATHYCPKGNAVRLRWSRGTPSEGMDFEFVDGTNLDDPRQSHQRAVYLKVGGADAFERGETYVANASSPAEIAAKPPGEVVRYRRTGPPAG